MQFKKSCQREKTLRDPIGISLEILVCPITEESKDHFYEDIEIIGKEIFEFSRNKQMKMYNFRCP
jgi:hypothetical protein